MIPDKLNICVPCFSKAAGPSPRLFHVRRVCGGVSRFPGEAPRDEAGNGEPRLDGRLSASGHAQGAAATSRSPLNFTCFSNRSTQNIWCPPFPPPSSFLGMCVIKPNRLGLSSFLHLLDTKPWGDEVLPALKQSCYGTAGGLGHVCTWETPNEPSRYINCPAAVRGSLASSSPLRLLQPSQKRRSGRSLQECSSGPSQSVRAGGGGWGRLNFLSLYIFSISSSHLL